MKKSAVLLPYFLILSAGILGWAFPVIAASDTTPPTVYLSAPANNAVIAGTITVSASATDNVGVVGVQFLLDGVNLGAEDLAYPYSVRWNTTTASSGRHTLSAKARDAAGNTTLAAAVNVTVDNQPPTGSIIIDGGASVTNSRNATLTLSATDTWSAVTQMRFSSTGRIFSAAQPYATTTNWTLPSGDGNKTVYVQYKDAMGNWSGSFTASIILDTTAPTISAVTSSNIASNSATVTWTTNEPATSQVEYGATTSYGASTTIDTTLVTSHSAAISGLAVGTIYDYRVRSKDAAGNERVGSNNAFTTLAAPPDTSPPSVPTNLVANPVSDSQINLSWTASTDNVGVTGYKVFRDGNQIATTTTGAFYSDVNRVPNTIYGYAVSAYDAAGNNSAQTAVVYATSLRDTTPPTVSISSPTNNSTISRIIALSATAGDDIGVAGVTFQVDGVGIATEDTTGPYGVNLDTTTLSDGIHTLTAIARDTSNNTTTSSPVSVTVDNTTLSRVTHLIATPSTSDASNYTSGSFTPTAGDLLVVFVVATGTVDPGAMTDTQDLGFGRAGTATKNSSADTIYVFVAQKLAAATSMTVSFLCPSDPATGAVIFVAGVSGMSRVGPAALRQVAVSNNQAANGTPAATFASSVLSGNPTLGMVGNTTNPAGLAPPMNWTQNAATGYTTPTAGAEYVSRDSGFTGTTVTWGSTSVSAFGVITVEIDTSPITSSQWPNPANNQPCVIQHMSTNITGNPGTNGFELHFPNNTLANNLLILAMTYDGDRTLTSIVDDEGNTWLQAATAYGRDIHSEVWYVVGSKAGVSKVTVTFDAAVNLYQISQFALTEVSGIAASSAIDGTPTGSTSSVDVIQPGSITTTVDGDLIYNYAMENYAYPLSDDSVTAITGDNASGLLSVSTRFKQADQFSIQSTSGSINPTLYTYDPNGRTWNSIAVAFKYAAAGTQPSSGIRVVRVQHVYPFESGSAHAQFPCTGNLLVFTTSNYTPNYAVTSLADNKANPYSEVTRDRPELPQVFFAANANPDLNMRYTWAQASTSTWYVLYDISGAATAPYDTYATATGSMTVANQDITNAPSITPTTSNGLIIAVIPFGTGPPSGAATTGMIFDSVYASGMTDGSNFDSGDGYAHFYNPDTNQVSFNWHMHNDGTLSYWDALAVAFKALSN